MGIREHLSKQADEKDLKLSDLTIEVESGESSSDWERLEQEITEEDRQRLVAYVKEQECRIDDYISALSKYKRLFPDDMDEFELDKKMRSDMWRCVEVRDETYKSTAACFKVLSPKLFAESDYKKRNYYELQREVDRAKREMDFDSTVLAAKRIRILFPDKLDQIDLDDHEQEQIGLNITAAEKKQNWQEYVGKLVAYRLVFEPKYGKIELDKERLKTLFDYVDEMRKRDDGDFLKYLVMLKMILADRIVIENNRFELVMPEKKVDLKEKSKERPVRKKF